MARKKKVRAFPSTSELKVLRALTKCAGLCSQIEKLVHKGKQTVWQSLYHLQRYGYVVHVREGNRHTWELTPLGRSLVALANELELGEPL